MKVVIREHLWMRGGSVGIGTRYISDLEIEIQTKDKAGQLLFPNTYKIKREKLLSYPVETFRKGVPVRVIPIKELEVM